MSNNRKNDRIVIDGVTYQLHEVNNESATELPRDDSDKSDITKYLDLIEHFKHERKYIMFIDKIDSEAEGKLYMLRKHDNTLVFTVSTQYTRSEHTLTLKDIHSLVKLENDDGEVVLDYQLVQHTPKCFIVIAGIYNLKTSKCYIEVRSLELNTNDGVPTVLQVRESGWPLDIRGVTSRDLRATFELQCTINNHELSVGVLFSEKHHLLTYNIQTSTFGKKLKLSDNGKFNTEQETNTQKEPEMTNQIQSIHEDTVNKMTYRAFADKGRLKLICHDDASEPPNEVLLSDEFLHGEDILTCKLIKLWTDKFLIMYALRADDNWAVGVRATTVTIIDRGTPHQKVKIAKERAPLVCVNLLDATEQEIKDSFKMKVREADNKFTVEVSFYGVKYKQKFDPFKMCFIPYALPTGAATKEKAEPESVVIKTLKQEFEKLQHKITQSNKTIDKLKEAIERQETIKAKYNEELNELTTFLDNL